MNAETVFDKANRIWEQYQPSYTPEQLLGAIEAAEHVLFACGTLVDLAQNDLDNARLAQRVSRDRVMELRQQLMQMEKLTNAQMYGRDGSRCLNLDPDAEAQQ